MSPFLLKYAIVGLASFTSVALSSGIPQAAALPLPAHILEQFPAPTWIENIAVRQNGALLFTFMLPNASLYQLSNPSGPKPCLSLVHTFPEVSGLLGIAETSPDVFVTVGANLSDTGDVVKESAKTFRIDLNRHKPVIKTITAIPEAIIPNGIAALPHQPSTVLISDTAAGLAWRVDTLTGEYDVGIQTPEMAVDPDSASPAGINGLHVFKGSLYFTNSFQAAIYRVEIAADGSMAPHARVETVAVIDVPFLDDFAIAEDGTIYAASYVGNRVIAVKPDGKGGYGEGVVVVGSETESIVSGDTSAAFGRTKSDRKTLYVVTSGAVMTANGTSFEGGRVVAVDTTGY